MWAPVLGRCVGLPCALRVYVHTSGCHARMTLGSSIIFFYAEHAHTLLAQLSVFCAGLVVKGCNLSTDQTTIDYLRRDSAENYPVRLNSSQRTKCKLRVPPQNGIRQTIRAPSVNQLRYLTTTEISTTEMMPSHAMVTQQSSHQSSDGNHDLTTDSLVLTSSHYSDGGDTSVDDPRSAIIQPTTTVPVDAFDCVRACLLVSSQGSVV